MRLTSVLALSVALVAASAGTSLAAAVLTTPSIPVGLVAAASGIICHVANVGSKEAEVTIEIVDSNAGAVVSTLGPIVMASMTSQTAFAAPTSNTYCRVTGLTSKTGRVTHFLRDPMTGVVVMTVVAP